MCMDLFPADWEYILPLFILSSGFSQYGVSLWSGYAQKASGTILSFNLGYHHFLKLHHAVIFLSTWFMSAVYN